MEYVKALEQGMTVEEVSRAYEVMERTVYRSPGVGKEGDTPMNQIAKKEGFADLQGQAAMALAWQDIDGARAAIRAMKEFVAMAERDLEKLIAWTRSSEETLR